MNMNLEEIINLYQLSGPLQVHIGNCYLVPDWRAHQIYLNPEDGFIDHLKDYYPEGIVCLKGDGYVVIRSFNDETPGGFYELVQILERLHGPYGCPWDQKQTHVSLMKHLKEEVLEVEEALDLQDDDEFREELGDVFLQPLAHATIRKMNDSWTIHDLIRELTSKLIRRHPHVFKDVQLESEEHFAVLWKSIKVSEKELKLQRPKKSFDKFALSYNRPSHPKS